MSLETDRELMQQAMEALTAYDGTNGESKRKRVLAALRERLAQPELERAITDAIIGGTGVMLGDKRIDPASIYKRQWQGLTDEEIEQAWASMNHDPAAFVHFAGGALWVEAKLQEKNG